MPDVRTAGTAARSIPIMGDHVSHPSTATIPTPPLRKSKQLVCPLEALPAVALALEVEIQVQDAALEGALEAALVRVLCRPRRHVSALRCGPY